MLFSLDHWNPYVRLVQEAKSNTNLEQLGLRVPKVKLDLCYEELQQMRTQMIELQHTWLTAGWIFRGLAVRFLILPRNLEMI